MSSHDIASSSKPHLDNGLDEVATGVVDAEIDLVGGPFAVLESDPGTKLDVHCQVLALLQPNSMPQVFLPVSFVNWASPVSRWKKFTMYSGP